MRARAQGQDRYWIRRTPDQRHTSCSRRHPLYVQSNQQRLQRLTVVRVCPFFTTPTVASLHHSLELVGPTGHASIVSTSISTNLEPPNAFYALPARPHNSSDDNDDSAQPSALFQHAANKVERSATPDRGGYCIVCVPDFPSAR